MIKFSKVSYEQFKKDCLSLGYECEDAILRNIYDAIELPKRSTVGSAGYDFHIPFAVTLEPYTSVTIPTGIRCKMDNGVVLCTFPRSGLGFKYRLQLNNTIGVIDADYFNADNEGHIMASLTVDSGHTVELYENDRFMQGIFLIHLVTDDDSVTDTRHGGLGSTGA